MEHRLFGADIGSAASTDLFGDHGTQPAGWQRLARCWVLKARALRPLLDRVTGQDLTIGRTTAYAVGAIVGGVPPVL